MNVLPFVSAFILLFAIGSYTFIHQFRAATWEKIYYERALKFQRLYASRCQKREYYKHKAQKKEATKDDSQKKMKKDIAYVSPRDRFNPVPESKLNIRKLLEDQENPLLEDIATNLINHLYDFTILEVDGRSVLKKIIEIVKKESSIETFEEVLAHMSDKDSAFFYKLVKGTHAHTLSSTEGYPALGDYLSLGEIKGPPICFSHASRPVLTAVFGEVLTPQIMNEEKHKWEQKHVHHPLKKEELEAFLIQHRKNFSEFEPFFKFSTSRKKSDVEIFQIQDSTMKIKVKK